MKNIAFLLGAGFSVPAGYPTAYDVSQKLMDYDNRYIYAHSSGMYYVRREFYSMDEGFFSSQNERTTWNGESPSWKEGSLMLEIIINIFREGIDNEINNYEVLYDYISDFRKDYENNSEKSLQAATKIASHKEDFYWGIWTKTLNKYLKEKNQSAWTTAVSHALLCFDFLINDIISNLKTGRSFLYEEFVKFIKHEQGESIHLFTLNHDLLLETIFQNNGIALSDGFEHGEFYSSQSPVMHYYSGNYTENNRIYKLHGSTNYWNYYYIENGVGTNKNVVIRHNSGDEHSFYIHDANHSQIMAENSGLILSGVETKKSRYQGPLASDIIPLFSSILPTCELVIIIGYSFMDSTINDILHEQLFNNKNIKTEIIGWRDKPDFLVKNNILSDQVQFYSNGIDNYNFNT